MSRNYWDSCIFIAYLADIPKERAKVEAIDALVRRALNGDDMIIVSTLVLAEVRSRGHYDEFRWNLIRDMFYTNRPYIRVVGLSPRIADLASTIGGDHNDLTVPDVIHIATALSEHVDVLLTLDGDRSKERRRSGDLLDYNRHIMELRIEPPRIPFDTQIRGI